MSLSIDASLNIPANWTTFLTILYRPLIGEQACTLYALLYGLANSHTKVEMEDIDALMLISPSLVIQARERLEEYDLLNSYANNEGQIVLLELCPPLNADAFMKHPIYRRLLGQKVGVEGMERIKRLLEPKKKRLKNISKALSLESEAEYSEASLPIPLNWHDPEQYDFDWEIFFHNMHRTIPQRLRTRQNMSYIAYLANLYGLGEIPMRHIVVRHMSDDKTSIDFDNVVEDLKKSNQIQEADPNNFSQSPVAFLKANQPKQAQVLPKEKAVLAKLSQTWQFSNELINTLVDYSMKQCQGQFIDRYILTVANNMARMNIQTREEALAYFENNHMSKVSSKKYGKSLGPEEVVVPSWYDTASQELASDEDIEELMRLGQQILQTQQASQQESLDGPSFLKDDPSASCWSAYSDLN